MLRSLAFCRASAAILSQSRIHVIRGTSTIGQLTPHIAQLTAAGRHFPASITLPFPMLISCCYRINLLLSDVWPAALTIRGFCTSLRWQLSTWLICSCIIEHSSVGVPKIFNFWHTVDTHDPCLYDEKLCLYNLIKTEWLNEIRIIMNLMLFTCFKW